MESGDLLILHPATDRRFYHTIVPVGGAKEVEGVRHALVFRRCRILRKFMLRWPHLMRLNKHERCDDKTEEEREAVTLRNQFLYPKKK